MRLAILFLIFLSACGKTQYELGNGQIVDCGAENETACGVDLTQCDGGDTYECQTNVVIIPN